MMENGGKRVLFIKFTQEALWIPMEMELEIFKGLFLS